MERRAPASRRRNSRSGRRATDPRPISLDLIDNLPPKQAILALANRIGAIEHSLHTQFQRIAQLQAVVDRLTAPLGRFIGKSDVSTPSKRS